jgi:hypothetical protein
MTEKCVLMFVILIVSMRVEEKSRGGFEGLVATGILAVLSVRQFGGVMLQIKEQR